MPVKIPSLSHRLHVEMLEGKNYLILTIKRGGSAFSETLSKVSIRAHSIKGMEDALIRSFNQGGIDHQVPKGILPQLAQELWDDAGYVQPKKSTFGSDSQLGVSQVQENIQESLASFQAYMEKLAETLTKGTMSQFKGLNEMKANINNIAAEIDKILRNQAGMDGLITQIIQSNEQNNDIYQERFKKLATQVEELTGNVDSLSSKVDVMHEILTKKPQKRRFLG